MTIRKPIVILLTILILPVTIISCSEDSKGPVDPLFVENNLVFERTDGSRVQFGSNVEIWCGPWEKGEIPIETLHITAKGSGWSYWNIRAVLEDVVPGEKIYFPNTFIWNQPEGADIFVCDEPNELSSSEEESHGWIMFEKVGCGRHSSVQFSIDAVLGSEYHDGDSLKVYGSFRTGIF
jgi:hypothetical protein